MPLAIRMQGMIALRRSRFVAPLRGSRLALSSLSCPPILVFQMLRMLRVLPLHVSISQVGTRKGRLAKLARQQCFILGAGVEEDMSLEVLVSGEATLADETLERLIGASGCGNRHFSFISRSLRDGGEKLSPHGGSPPAIDRLQVDNGSLGVLILPPHYLDALSG